MVALDGYDGREWRPGNDTMKGTTDDAFLRMDTLVDNPARGAAVRAAHRRRQGLPQCVAPRRWVR